MIVLARTESNELVSFNVNGPTLVPKNTVRLDSTKLDAGRAGLWLFAPWAERDPGVYGLYPYDLDDKHCELGPREDVDLDAPDHHLIVLQCSAGPAMSSAVEEGLLEEVSDGAYVTTSPVTFETVRDWLVDSELACAFSGKSQSVRIVEGSIALFQSSEVDAPLTWSIQSEEHTLISKLPPDWQTALLATTAVRAIDNDTIDLNEVCDDVRAIDEREKKPKSAEALLDLFAAARRTPKRKGSPARAKEVFSFSGPAPFVPEDAAGRTIQWRRGLDPPALIAVGFIAVVGTFAGSFPYLLIGPGSFTPWQVGVGLLCLWVGLRMHQPWEVTVGPKKTQLQRWGQRTSLRHADAIDALQRCGALASLARIRAEAAKERRPKAETAAREWLDLTREGCALRDSAGHKSPPMVVLFVGDGVRAAPSDVWLREKSWQTATSQSYEWRLKVTALRRAADGADIVLVPTKRGDTREAKLLGSSTQPASALRKAIKDLGGTPV